MAEKRSITDTREQKRRLGLLALNGSEPYRSGYCPEPEEIAELLDGSCDRRRREELLLHLDSCGTCFQEWLALSDVLKTRRSRKPGGVSFFSRKKVLAAAGSAFAVAASVVVFMSTPFYKESLPLSTQGKIEQAGKAQVAERMIPEPEDSEEKTAAASIPAAAEEEMPEQNKGPDVQAKSKRSAPLSASPIKTNAYRMKESADQDDEVKKARKPLHEAVTPAPEPEIRVEQARKDSLQDAGTMVGTDFSGPGEYQDFLRRAAGFCRGESSDVNLETLLKRAKYLRKTVAGEGHRSAVIEKIEKLLEEDILRQELCARLEPILCSEGVLDCGEIIRNQQGR